MRQAVSEHKFPASAHRFSCLLASCVWFSCAVGPACASQATARIVDAAGRERRRQSETPADAAKISAALKFTIPGGSRDYPTP